MTICVASLHAARALSSTPDVGVRPTRMMRSGTCWSTTHGTRRKWSYAPRMGDGDETSARASKRAPERGSAKVGTPRATANRVMAGPSSPASVDGPATSSGRRAIMSRPANISCLSRPRRRRSVRRRQGLSSTSAASASVNRPERSNRCSPPGPLRSSPSMDSGSRGLSKGTLRCTGPPGGPRACLAAARTSSTIELGPVPSRPDRDGRGRSDSNRTRPPKIPGWSIVWFASAPRSRGGRSAVISTIGTSDMSASTTAGSRLATAVPDVVITAAGPRWVRP